MSLFKGTHTVYFSISVYNINQKTMIPRIGLHCKTTRVSCSSGDIRQCICIFCDSVFSSWMALSFNLNGKATVL